MTEKMVDRVVKIANNYKNIRNIAICAHIDHGKTTFSDNLLAGAGMMSEELAGKACLMDFHDDEQERGITIDTASVSMVHTFKGEDYLINLMDTPGHVDFGGDVTRAMRAVDGAVVLCCASEGIMPQTETVLRQALKERVKPVLFINKVDRLIKELQLTPEQMQERFIGIINNVNRLINKIAEEGYGKKWQTEVQNGSVAFGSAYHNWALSIPYMKEKNITFKDIIDAYKAGEDKYKELAKKAPLHEVILNMVINHLPDPVTAQNYRIEKIWHGDIESEDGQALKKCDPNGNLFFTTVKIVVDPQAGEISTGRLYAGTITKGTEVYLNKLKQEGRIQQIFIMNGAKREIVEKIPCGNIIGISGIKSSVGETVTIGESTPFEQITHIFDPVISKSIEAKNPADLPKLVEVLKTVAKEDPTIQIEINEETGENLLHGMGELHLEIIENRIKTEKGVEVKTSPPIVVYREAITKESPEAEGKSPNKHNRFYIKVEPLDDSIYEAMKKGDLPNNKRLKKKDNTIREVLVNCGMDSKIAVKVKGFFNGNIFLDQTRGQVHIGEVIEMILDMFEDVMKKGPLAREPCIKVKVSLMDMKLHEDAIHRGPAQVYPAVRESIRGAMMQARPIVYEPLQTLHIEGPADNMGDISKLIANKRGQLLEMDQEGDLVVAKAKLPVGEMFGWSSELRSATSGRGTSSLIDQSFEKLPEELQEKIINNIKNRKGLTDAQVGV
ncbi:elongation factor EF-2 [Candidatus Woesearchaeota archaeon B3_Woes]|nr:MAG: elongation factor EF-2 [Candidatus Woesearchaeota archaeon B3_Woes]